MCVILAIGVFKHFNLTYLLSTVMYNDIVFYRMEMHFLLYNDFLRK